jgi:hypothetical protein
VTEWARARLESDAHSDPAFGGAYQVHTLYLDTAAFDVYHRSESFRRRKFRLRRYGREALVYLEQKTRTGDRVSKRRASAPDDCLRALASGAAASDWAWFATRVSDRRLQPALRISYLRTAFVAPVAGVAPRLTIDHALVADRAAAWDFGETPRGVPLPEDLRIVELKYQGALPPAFKDLVATCALQPAVFSKYRCAVDALGLARHRTPGQPDA